MGLVLVGIVDKQSGAKQPLSAIEPGDSALVLTLTKTCKQPKCGYENQLMPASDTCIWCGKEL